MLKPVTAEQWSALLDEQQLGEEARARLQTWFDRGDGAAVYRNEALDSGSAGHRVTLSFGSAVAQLETAEPPERMPDIGTYIGWKYRLEATYRG